MRQKMRPICEVVIVSLALSLGAATQNEAPKPKVSNEPLTAEQVAVYRAVLEDYTKDADGALNLANKTEPLDQSGLWFDRTCIKGITLEAAENTVPDVHHLDPAVALNLRIVLVDPARQEEKIKNTDLEDLVNRAIDDREEVTDKQLDDSVKQAFNNGLFTLSEIAFDKEHRRAVLTYSFVCGRLCGHGNTLVLKKVGQKWKVSKTCGGRIS